MALMAAQRVRRVSLIVIVLATAHTSLAVADTPEPSATFKVPARGPSALEQQDGTRTGNEFRDCLAAARTASAAKKAYDTGRGSLAELYSAQQALTAARIYYSKTSTGVRGNPELGAYFARRGEVAALEHGLAEVTNLEVADDEQALREEEIDRYAGALKLAHKELAKAERVWKTADRVQQFRYLNRRTASPR